MTRDELLQHIHRLDLHPAEAAQLLGVATRTFQRWIEGEEVPGPAERALRAWLRLKDNGLAWRPDAESLSGNDAPHIATHLAHTIALNDLLSRVGQRLGHRSLWTVDRAKCKATLGPMEVAFYKLRSGSFSLASYRRTDSQMADVIRDGDMLEEAAYCIALEMRKEPDWGPVVVVHHSGSPKKGVATPYQQEFTTNREAMQFAFQLLEESPESEPFIKIGESPSPDINPVLWNTRELVAEYERSRNPDFAICRLSPGEFAIQALSERAQKAYRLKAGHMLVFKGDRDLRAYVEHAQAAGFSVKDDDEILSVVAPETARIP